MADHLTSRVTLRHIRGFEFVAAFPDLENVAPLLVDEGPPLGEAKGPNPAALLGAAVGQCLASSLIFCLKKSRAELGGLDVEVTTALERNPAGRLRIANIDVNIDTTLPSQDAGRLARCEDLFEDFCIVTESVRRGIPVNVTVREASEVVA